MTKLEKYSLCYFDLLDLFGVALPVVGVATPDFFNLEIKQEKYLYSIRLKYILVRCIIYMKFKILHRQHCLLLKSTTAFPGGGHMIKIHNNAQYRMM